MSNETIAPEGVTNEIKDKIKAYEDKFKKESVFYLTYAFDANLFDDYYKELEYDDANELETEVIGYLENKFFEIVSLILQRATFGQHKLVTLKEEKDNSEEADILITKYSTNVYGRVWNKGQN